MPSATRGKKLALFLGAITLLCLAALLLSYGSTIARWYLLLTEFERLPDNAEGLPEYRYRKTGILFIKLPGGKFLMGTAVNEPGSYDDDEPVHEVEVAPFLIAKYETTKGQWDKLTGSSLSAFRNDSEYAVDDLSWSDAQSYSKKVGLRLPTEEEWEYACRGPEAARGGPFAGSGRADDMAWHYSNSGRQKHPVGAKEPNGFGLHDMHGNVAEWCDRKEGRRCLCFAGAQPPKAAGGAGARAGTRAR
jgi:formylglycine-generating enzyme required for sulfatase activity